MQTVHKVPQLQLQLWRTYGLVNEAALSFALSRRGLCACVCGGGEGRRGGTAERYWNPPQRWSFLFRIIVLDYFLLYVLSHSRPDDFAPRAQSRFSMATFETYQKEVKEERPEAGEN